MRGILVNSYVITQICRREAELPPLRSQKKFREGIIRGFPRKAMEAAKTTPVHPNDTFSHRKLRLKFDTARLV